MKVRSQFVDVKILLVEGHPALREAMAGYLSYHGAEVRSYPDPDAATAAGTDFCPNILLCEIKIPAQGAFLLLNHLRRFAKETDCNVMAVGLSGLSGSADEPRILSAGYDAVLQKPFGPGELLQLLFRLRSR